MGKLVEDILEASDLTSLTDEMSHTCKVMMDKPSTTYTITYNAMLRKGSQLPPSKHFYFQLLTEFWKVRLLPSLYSGIPYRQLLH